MSPGYIGDKFPALVYEEISNTIVYCVPGSNCDGRFHSVRRREPPAHRAGTIRQDGCSKHGQMDDDFLLQTAQTVSDHLNLAHIDWQTLRCFWGGVIQRNGWIVTRRGDPKGLSVLPETQHLARPRKKLSPLPNPSPAFRPPRFTLQGEIIPILVKAVKITQKLPSV